jgi:ZIP family zinc transporter
MDPTLTVLLYSSIAAGAAALGAVPLALRRTLPTAGIGWANALAAGVMLGVAYTLMVVGLDRAALHGAAGAVCGLAWVFFTHAASGTEDLDLNRLQETTPAYGYQVLLVNMLHAASEGVAIGAAMAVNLSFGVFLALAIGVHNVAEASVFSAILGSRGLRARDAAGLSVTANVNQVLLAIVTFALVGAVPLLLPWALGFAAGALIYLVLAELLPECYRQTGRISVALVTILAMGMVVLLGGSAR